MCAMRRFDIIVIGAGAAGVMAAGVAASRGCRVLLCEKMEKPQRKVRITGKGRCNLTNMRPHDEFLAKVRAGADFFAPSFTLFDNRRTVEFFEKIGVPLTVERGDRVFPTSSKAWDIADAHVAWCKAQGVTIETFSEVTDIDTVDGRISGVVIKRRLGERETVGASCVIIATGGLSYPATGSTGDGLMFAHRLGHSIEEVRPSLTPLETEPVPPRELKGLSLRNISVSLNIDSEVVATEFGEMEFTPFGVSGPVILRLSRMAVDALIDGRTARLSVDLKPALSREKISGRIDREIAGMSRGATVGALMPKLMPSALVSFFLKQAGLRSSHSAPGLDDVSKENIIRSLKGFDLELTDYRPFEEAIVTAGGVSLLQVDPSSLASMVTDGLFFAGEVLDIDADTGGYNLQIAYSTGYAAGLGAVSYINGGR